MRLHSVVAAVVSIAAAIMPGISWSQGYPEKPITIVVPFAPGASDTAVRILAEKMGTTLGQRVLVESRAGASGAIGTEYVMRANPDGYTLLFSTATQMSLNPQLRKVNYDPLSDFTNIGMIAVAPYVLAVNAKLPAKSLKELVTYAKSTSEPLRMGNAGVNSLSDLSARLFGERSGVKVLPVAFKGTHPAAIALESGECPALIATYITFTAGLQAGRVRVLAVAADKRLESAPDIPTFAEAGMPGYVVQQWWGLNGPKGLPEAVVNKLNSALNTALRDEDLKQRFTTLGAIPLGGTPADHTAYVKKEFEQWSRVIASSPEAIQKK